VILPLNEPRRFICHACEELFEPVAEPFCARCGAPSQTEIKKCASCFGREFLFSHNHAAFTYDELIRDLLHEMKFREKKRVAEGLGFLWAEYFKNNEHAVPENISSYELLPMPMHPKKRRERGFNQAEILTRPLAARFQIPISNALIRTFDTPPQSELHPSQRAENVNGVFSVRKNEIVHGKNYILTDDIFTTGASLNECTKILLNAGAADILCMTLAISVKNNNKD
jgi:ComF family protein